MAIYPIPYNFLEKIGTLTWHDYYYGYKHSFIVIDTLIQFALHEIESSEENNYDLIQLASASPKEVYFIESLVEKIKNSIEIQATDISKWLNLILLWVFINKHVFNLQEAVDSVYADFDYPQDIKHLISYMPYEGEAGAIEEKLLNFLCDSGYGDFVKGIAS